MFNAETERTGLFKKNWFEEIIEFLPWKGKKNDYLILIR